MSIIGNPVMAGDRRAYLLFSSPTANFSLVPGDGTVAGKDGILEYSLDGIHWGEWDELTPLSSALRNDIYILMIRGTGNTVITGSGAGTATHGWHFTGSDISVEGNIASLLDWRTVANGYLPEIGVGAFRVLFGHQTSAPGSAIKYAHKLFLPYLTIPNEGYQSLLQAQTSLISIPAFPATTIGELSYRSVFQACSALEVMPYLPVTAFPPSCFYQMFKDCSSLMISATKTGGYQYPVRFPPLGTGAVDTDSFTNMFQNTGGTFTGTPDVNVTYYTTNPLVQ